MPKDWLPVPHYKQSAEGQCLAACVCMVLSYPGREMEETRIASILRSYSFGTPAPNIRYLESLGLSVRYGQMSVSRLCAHLQQDTPCILFVQANELPYSRSEGFHAVVVVGLRGETAYVNDPALDFGPQSVSFDDLRLAWSEFEYKGAVITS
jgi:ABC-type bacteriocin/lantibiotic exporter with double-glycine peptidase domain